MLGAFLCKRPDLMGWWKDLAFLSFLQWNFVQSSFRTSSYRYSDRLHGRSCFLGDFKGRVNSCLKRRWEDKLFQKWGGTNHGCPRWIRITYQLCVRLGQTVIWAVLRQQRVVEERAEKTPVCRPSNVCPSLALVKVIKREAQGRNHHGLVNKHKEMGWVPMMDGCWNLFKWWGATVCQSLSFETWHFEAFVYRHMCTCTHRHALIM